MMRSSCVPLVLHNQNFGFVSLQDNELHLYLPMATVEEVFAEQGQ